MFYISLTDRPALKEVFDDLRQDSETTILYTPYEIRNRLLKLLFRIHMSKKINDRINLPYKSVWKKYYKINNQKIDWNTDNYLVIIDSALVWYSPKYLNGLRNKGMKLILLAFNPFSQLKQNPTFWNVYSGITFDLVLSTFDIRDPKEYGTVQTYAVYSKYFKESSFIRRDLFFLGMDKGRHNYIKHILDLSREMALSCDFNIINYHGSEEEKCENIRYCGEVKYSEYLKKMSESKCILEIVQEGQIGITLRTFEAIVYNKMLLTNNEHIVDMPFYNSKYMKVFHDLSDIDLSFINSENEIDYGYDNQFSPVLIKDQIKSAILVR